MNHWIETSGTLDLWQVGIANFFLAGSLTALVIALWGATASWRTDRNLGAMCGVVGLALVVRLLIAPKWIATVFIGYKATQQSIDLLPLSHYGAGATALYHHLLGLFGNDHLVIIWSNAVMGVITVPLVMTFTRKMTQSARVGLVVGLLVALAPILIRNDTSDANNVPCLLWLFCGLTLLVRALTERNRWFLWWACFPLALAVVSRPEMVVIAGGLVVATMVALPVPKSWRHLLVDSLFFVPFLALTIPHWMHIWRASEALHLGGNIKSFGTSFSLLENNALLEPTMFGVGYLLVAVVGTVLLWRNHRRWLIAMWMIIIAAVALYSVDLDRANLARAHVPATLLVTLLAAHGLVEIGARLKRSRVAVVLAWGLVLGSNIPPLMTLWQPTNEQTEETLIREALDAIDTPDFTLLRLSHPDSDRAQLTNRGHTHYHFPDYLIQNEERRGWVMPLSAWLVDGRGQAGRRTYFFRGIRCYAEFRWGEDSPPKGRNEHPLCRAMLQLPNIKPVFEHTVPNHGNVWINYYGDSDDFVVGLYRIDPPATAPK
jgi:hypothetical protein